MYIDWLIALGLPVVIFLGALGFIALVLKGSEMFYNFIRRQIRS
jgi:hypothetical protein